MVKVCECCGHPVIDRVMFLELTHMQQKLFEAVEKSGQAGIGRREIFDHLYGTDPNGGPDSLNIINVQKARMKPVLAKYGLKMTTVTGGHYACWRLEKI